MIIVAVGLIFRNSRKEVLLCQRKPEFPYPHKREFPGGKVNNGEQIEECLKRELWEELHIPVRCTGFYYCQTNEYPKSGVFDVAYYLVHRYDGIPVNYVFNEISLASINDLQRYDILEGNSAVVQKLLHEYGKI